MFTVRHSSVSVSVMVRDCASVSVNTSINMVG